MGKTHVGAAGPVRALDSLSLGIAADALTAVLGPSGCGKTTLLRVLAGLEDPEEGEVTLAGRTVASPASTVAPEDRGVSLVFQDLALWPHMTVRENIGFPLEARGAEPGRVRERVEEAAAATAIAHRLDAFPATLSGGERQRAALARALAPEPRLLLLDEPFGGLDAVLRLRMLEVVAEARARLRIAAVLVTHDQAEALGAADRVVVMREGRVAQEGTAGEVYAEPRSRFVASFVGLASFLPGRSSGGPAATALGPIPFRGRARQDGSVLLAARPEEMALDPAGPVRGTAGRSLFRGDGWIVGVEAGGERLLVRSGAPCERGAEVGVRFLREPLAVEDDGEVP
ncbi:MAG: ABC transporter ATP-binding protein [Planctomycetes bacterium]|nr:ABC transporter ATP-binding protein [Planctomycetota bacterium]